MLNTIQDKREKYLYLMTFVVIYLTDSLLFATNNSQIFIYAKRFGVILIDLIMLLFQPKSNRLRVPVFLLGMSCSILISSFFAGRFFNGYSYYTMIAIIWFGYLFSERYSFHGFADSFCTIMRLIAIVSLVCWLSNAVVRTISFLPTITNVLGLQYKCLFLTNVPVKVNLARRNLGPFWEPGAFQVYLIVALYFTLFIRKNKKKWIDTGIFIATALSTLSGAALIPIILLISAYLFDNKNIKGFALSIASGLFLVLLMSTGGFEEIMHKLSGDNSTNSLAFRVVALEGAWKGFLSNPLFGSSPEQNDLIKSVLSQQYIGSDYSSNANTFVNYLAYYGIYVGGFMILNSFRLALRSVDSKVSAIIVFLAYFLTTSNENMTSSLLIGVLAIYGWMESRNAKRGEKRK